MKRELLRAALLLAFLACAAALLCAAEPKAVIVGPAVEHRLPGNLVVLSSEGSIGSGHNWSFDGPVEPELCTFVVNDGHVMIFACRTEGRYVFTLAVTEEGKIHQAKKVILNFEEDPNPQPDPEPEPEPEPDPDPGPVPPPGERFVLVVLEASEPSAKRAQLLTGFRRYLVKKGHDWHIEDDDLPDVSDKTPPWFQWYLDKLKALGVPHPALCIGVPAKDGKSVTNLKCMPLPKTAEEAIQAVKDQGG
jgi:hypothetical protein